METRRRWCEHNCETPIFHDIRRQDGCAEMLASIRRGPGAAPTDEDKIDYLMHRRPHAQERPAFEHYSFEHDSWTHELLLSCPFTSVMSPRRCLRQQVLSYQRRVHAIKENFLKRGSRTPLGRAMDWWDC